MSLFTADDPTEPVDEHVDKPLPRLVFPAPQPDPALRDRCPETPYTVHTRQRRAA